MGVRLYWRLALFARVNELTWDNAELSHVRAQFDPIPALRRYAKAGRRDE